MNGRLHMQIIEDPIVASQVRQIITRQMVSALASAPASALSDAQECARFLTEFGFDESLVSELSELAMRRANEGNADGQQTTSIT